MSGSVDTAVDLGGLVLRNPVLTASGTFGYGTEFAPFVKVSLELQADTREARLDVTVNGGGTDVALEHRRPRWVLGRMSRV